MSTADPGSTALPDDMHPLDAIAEDLATVGTAIFTIAPGITAEFTAEDDPDEPGPFNRVLGATVTIKPDDETWETSISHQCKLILTVGEPWGNAVFQALSELNAAMPLAMREMEHADVHIREMYPRGFEPSLHRHGDRDDARDGDDASDHARGRARAEWFGRRGTGADADAGCAHRVYWRLSLSRTPEGPHDATIQPESYDLGQVEDALARGETDGDIVLLGDAIPYTDHGQPDSALSDFPGDGAEVSGRARRRFVRSLAPDHHEIIEFGFTAERLGHSTSPATRLHRRIEFVVCTDLADPLGTASLHERREDTLLHDAPPEGVAEAACRAIDIEDLHPRICASDEEMPPFAVTAPPSQRWSSAATNARR